MHQKDFQSSESRYCSCSAFSFYTVGHVKKTPLYVKKNNSAISDSSLLEVFLKIVASLELKIKNQFLKNTCEEVCLQKGCRWQEWNFTKNLTSSPQFFKNAPKIISYQFFFQMQEQLIYRNNFQWLLLYFCMMSNIHFKPA